MAHSILHWIKHAVAWLFGAGLVVTGCTVVLLVAVVFLIRLRQISKHVEPEP